MDVTLSKRAEEDVRQLNAELERRVAERTRELSVANKELESFSYSVSHDLRAPLRAIDGFSQALVEDYGDRMDETARGHLRRVRMASQRMGQLIDDLLEPVPDLAGGAARAEGSPSPPWPSRSSPSSGRQPEAARRR